VGRLCYQHSRPGFTQAPQSFLEAVVCPEQYNTASALCKPSAGKLPATLPRAPPIPACRLWSRRFLLLATSTETSFRYGTIITQALAVVEASLNPVFPQTYYPEQSVKEKASCLHFIGTVRISASTLIITTRTMWDGQSTSVRFAGVPTWEGRKIQSEVGIRNDHPDFTPNFCYKSLKILYF
jgi:hypothetical protein